MESTEVDESMENVETLTFGDHPGIFQVGPLRVGIAVCADCLHPDYFFRYAEGNVDLLFVPNASPWREGEAVRDKYRRDQEIFVDGAARSGAYVIKVCGTGTIYGHRLQGRSLIAAPWGVMHRVPPEEEDRAQVICATLSLQELREFRQQFQAQPAGP